MASATDNDNDDDDDDVILMITQFNKVYLHAEPTAVRPFTETAQTYTTVNTTITYTRFYSNMFRLSTVIFRLY